MEGGGSVTFHVPDGWGPMDMAALAEEAIAIIDGKPVISRLRVSFRKAQV